MGLWDGLFLQVAYVARPSGLDRYGQTTMGAPTAFACRYQPSNALVRKPTGDQAVASAVLYTAESISNADLVYPPGSNINDPDAARSPLRVDAEYDLLSGEVDHWRITL